MFKKNIKINRNFLLKKKFVKLNFFKINYVIKNS